MSDALWIILVLAVLVGLFIQSSRIKGLIAEQELERNRWRLQFEGELAKARDERDRLLDALGDSFLLVQPDGMISFSNAAAKRLFNKKELKGLTVQETVLDGRLSEALTECLKTGNPVEKRVVLPQQTSPRGDSEDRGFTAWVIDAAPLSDIPGGSTDTRVVIRDVTSQHQLDQIRKDFVANASHELRTPMAIISGYLENLLEDDMVDDPETARRFLKVMRKHSDRISRIVEDMLVISKLESGEASAIKIKPFKVLPCIEDVLERLDSMVEGNNSRIDISLHDPELMINGDRFYWTQVMFNLVENALKQNPNQDLVVEVGSEVSEEGVHIWVKDNGVGIPTADLPHIFRRFYRVEKHHSQLQIAGTGLGLSIVKRAVEAHRGKISVTSIPGRETKFVMTLPNES